jgi:hypothetical protein
MISDYIYFKQKSSNDLLINIYRIISVKIFDKGYKTVDNYILMPNFRGLFEN